MSFECVVDWCLVVESNQFALFDTVVAQALPDFQAIIVCWIAIEVPTMPILSWLLRHVDPCIYVVSLSCLHPTVDLDIDLCGQRQMHDMELFPRPAILHGCSIHIVLGLNKRVLPIRWESCQDWCPVPRCGRCPNDELVVLQEWASESDCFQNRQPARGMCRFVLTLYLNSAALNNPILALRVETHMFLVKGDDVGVAPNNANACWACGWLHWAKTRAVHTIFDDLIIGTLPCSRRRLI